LTAKDAFMINLGILNFLVGVPLAFTTALFLFPGLNVPAAFLLGFFASVPFALIYIQMGAAMPRSGGDYAWVSRTLHPALGFMTSFSLYFISFYCCMSAISYTFSTFFLSSSFAVLAAFTGNTTFASWSTLTAEPVLAGSFAIMGTFAFTSHAAYVAAFDRYATGLGSTFQGVINAATKAGWSPVSNPLAAVAALPVTLISYGGFTYASYTAGELRHADKSLNRSIFGALLLGLLLWAGTGYVIFSTVGSQWMNAAAYLANVAPASNPLKVSPNIIMGIGVLVVGNPFLFWLIFIGFVAAYLIFMPSYFQVLTRAIFAWSFDRMAPSWLSDVNTRTHTPIKAIIVTFVIAVAFAAVWAFGSLATTYINSTIAWTAIFLIPSIAAMVFPFRKKQFFESAPDITKRKIGGVPIVSIAGASLFILLMVAIVYGYLTPAFSGPTTLPAILISSSFFLVGLAIFFVVKAYRKSQGIDMDRIYREIPPE
jgi:basic amino acid/polyamine antiporter, APA family